MRTIKFRAQKESDGAWVYGDLITTPIHSDCAILENGCINYAVKRETVGQYTGLIDQNGNEIYEGDIVGNIKLGVYNGAIIFSNASFLWLNETLGFDGYSEPYDTKEWAIVVGNIYNNPELINHAKD